MIPHLPASSLGNIVTLDLSMKAHLVEFNSSMLPINGNSEALTMVLYLDPWHQNPSALKFSDGPGLTTQKRILFIKVYKID